MRITASELQYGCHATNGWISHLDPPNRVRHFYYKMINTRYHRPLVYTAAFRSVYVFGKVADMWSASCYGTLRSILCHQQTQYYDYFQATINRWFTIVCIVCKLYTNNSLLVLESIFIGALFQLLTLCSSEVINLLFFRLS